MSEIAAITALAWGEAADLHAAVALAWGEAADLQSLGSGYVPPAPGGGIVIAPGSLAPQRDIRASTTYLDTSALEVIDLRDDAVLPVVAVSIDLPEGSDLWTLQASGPAALADALRAGEQPATVEVRLGPDAWRFVVEEIDQTLTFESRGVTVRGRSLAAIAGAPYQPVQSWVVDAPTTAAQVAALANLFTGLDVDWLLTDWPVPAGAWSASADPLGVVRQMAAAVGAVVEAHRTEARVTVRSRYPSAPNLWPSQRPDVQIAEDALEVMRSERVDQPPYDGVLVSGLLTGGLLQARLAGTSGSLQAPPIVDPLLTDTAAQIERAEAVLHGFGGRSRETRTLQLHGGVVRRGALVRCMESAGAWVGMVRAVSVQASLSRARQTLTMERPTSFPLGAIAPEPVPPACVPDPYFENVVLLLLFDGEEGATTFVDSSNYAREPVNVQAPVEIVADDRGFGSRVARFSGGYIQYANSPDFAFGAGDFTVETKVWFNSESIGSRSVFFGDSSPGGPGNSFSISKSTDNRLSFSGYLTSGTYAAASTRTIVAEEGYHIALDRRGTRIALFVNGERWAETSSSLALATSTNRLGVGVAGEYALAYGGTYGTRMMGKMGVVRITKGVSRYDEDFDPPSLPFCSHS